MQINVSGHHVEITPALKDYVAGKLNRIERHFDHVTLVNVVLTIERITHKAEATINVSGGQIHADAEHEDMYAAIDALADKVDRQIRKHKEKLTDHHRSEGGLKAPIG